MIDQEIETIKRKLDQLAQTDPLVAGAYEAAYQNNLSDTDKFALLASFALEHLHICHHQIATMLKFQELSALDEKFESPF